MRECADCEHFRTVNDPHPGAPFCIKHWKQALLTSTCPEFKHADPFPSTELSPSERKAYWEWKQKQRLGTDSFASVLMQYAITWITTLKDVKE